MRHQITRGVFVLTCFHDQTGGVSLDYIAQGVYPNKMMHDAYVNPAGETAFLSVQVRLIIGLDWCSETREQQSGVTTTSASKQGKNSKVGSAS